MPAAFQTALPYPSRDRVALAEKNTMQVPNRNSDCCRNLSWIQGRFREMSFDELFNSCLVLRVASQPG